MSYATKGTLSPARRRLLEMMQKLDFGRIEDLSIRCGEPIFAPAPRVVRHIKLGSENAPRPELNCPDFALKRQVVELFDHFVQLGNGSIEALEVQHGLPFRLIVRHTA